MNQSAQHSARGGVDGIHDLASAQEFELKARQLHYLDLERLSPWSQSSAKRIFDCLCVLLALPLLVPVFLAIALAVRFTSSGPVFFLQRRMGRQGRAFTLLKFRTLIHTADRAHHPITTAYNQCFTPAGSFLRRWKLDELPQLLNVLWGDMSLVGPRPKMLEHVTSNLTCRPGITGAANIAFALEEEVLDRVPTYSLESCYHTVVLPAKFQLDAEYMALATFLSDLKLILDSVLRRWDTSIMEGLLYTEAIEDENTMLLSRASDSEGVSARVLMSPSVNQSAPAD